MADSNACIFVIFHDHKGSKQKGCSVRKIRGQAKSSSTSQDTFHSARIDVERNFHTMANGTSLVNPRRVLIRHVMMIFDNREKLSRDLPAPVLHHLAQTAILVLEEELDSLS